MTSPSLRQVRNTGHPGHPGQKSAQPERPPRQSQEVSLLALLYQIPKLPVTPIARLLLFSCWYCEHTGEHKSVTASNGTLADWTNSNEKTIRNAKRQLQEKGLIDFKFKSRGRGDEHGSTDVFVVKWDEVDRLANAHYEARRRAREARLQAKRDTGRRSVADDLRDECFGAEF